MKGCDCSPVKLKRLQENLHDNLAILEKLAVGSKKLQKSDNNGQEKYYLLRGSLRKLNLIRPLASVLDTLVTTNLENLSAQLFRTENIEKLYLFHVLPGPGGKYSYQLDTLFELSTDELIRFQMKITVYHVHSTDLLRYRGRAEVREKHQLVYSRVEHLFNCGFLDKQIIDELNCGLEYCRLEMDITRVNLVELGLLRHRPLKMRIDSDLLWGVVNIPELKELGLLPPVFDIVLDLERLFSENNTMEHFDDTIRESLEVLQHSGTLDGTRLGYSSTDNKNIDYELDQINDDEQFEATVSTIILDRLLNNSVLVGLEKFNEYSNRYGDEKFYIALYKIADIYCWCQFNENDMTCAGFCRRFELSYTRDVKTLLDSINSVNERDMAYIYSKLIKNYSGAACSVSRRHIAEANCPKNYLFSIV